jgi:hypothetical protein
LHKDDLIRLFPLMRRLDRTSHAYVPPCVYFLVEKSEIVYVGKSENLRCRLNDHRIGSEHTSKKKFTEVFYIPIRLEILYDAERAFIKFVKAKLNCEWRSTSRIKYRKGMEPLGRPFTEKELAIIYLLILL